MDSPVLHIDGCQQMEQLDFREGGVMMAGSVSCFLKRVRMDNCRSMLDMDVYKEGNTTIVRNEEHR